MSIIHRLLKIKPGKERWSIKTGTDSGVSAVVTFPHPTTIDYLAHVPAPHPLPAASRVPPIEHMVWQLDDVELVEGKEEADGDYHLVLRSPSSGATMIAEIPNPDFVGASSPFKAQIAQARADMDAAHQIGGGMTTIGRRITITGVGFLDAIHGQTGVAPSGAEIHPVLSISFLPSETRHA